MIRTIGAAIGVLIVVFFMSDIASHLGEVSRSNAVGTAGVVKR